MHRAQNIVLGLQTQLCPCVPLLCLFAWKGINTNHEYQYSANLHLVLVCFVGFNVCKNIPVASKLKMLNRGVNKQKVGGLCELVEPIPKYYNL